MTEDEYIAQRLDDQIDWYSNKAALCQRRYRRLQLIEMIAAALIPFLSGMSAQIEFAPWLIGALGVIVALATAVSALLKDHENWIQYRTTAEKLKQEKFLFATGCQPYDTTGRFPLLVQRTEATIASEATTWAQTSQRRDPGDAGNLKGTS